MKRNIPKKIGKVFLVGAGPGNPDLITVYGKRLIEQADVIVVDALVDERLFKNARAQIVFMGKRGAPHKPGGFSTPQEVINRLLVRLGRQGRKVVRLKGGDPFLFGRGSEEVEALKEAGIPCEVVPGVTSALGLPALLGIPVTDRRWSSQVTIVTGHGQSKPQFFEGSQKHVSSLDISWGKIPKDGTLVVLMGVSRWKTIQKSLLQAGWLRSRPVVAIERGSLENQRLIRTTLVESAETFEKKKLVAPAIILVGEVARLGLQAPRVVVTRPEGQSTDLISRLDQMGFDVVVAPTIRIKPLGKKIQLQRSRYDWILFLSANAVRNFKLKSLHYYSCHDADKCVTPAEAGVHILNSPSGSRIKNFRDDDLSSNQFPTISNVMAVGLETKRVAESQGWHVDRVPKTFSSKGILASLGNLRGKSILIPRVQGAPRDLSIGLKKRGAFVEEIVTYETQSATFSPALKKKIWVGVDAVTFTSASTVRGFLKNFSRAEIRRIFSKVFAISIGSQTSAALRAGGIRQICEARQATMDDLVHAVKSVIRRGTGV